MTPGWFRYKASQTCIICGHGGKRGHPSGCMYTGTIDAPGAVLCLRVDKGAFKTARNGMGFLHRINDDPHYVRPVTRRQEARVADHEMQAIHNKCLAGMTLQLFGELCKSLGVSEESLCRLSLGWHEQYSAYSFPMRDESNAVIGIRLRSINGKKWSVTNSRSGIFIPRKLPCSGPIYVVEGPTDTAAMLTLGLCCIGRPSNTAGNQYIVDYAKRFLPRRDVVIVQNNDPIGSDARRMTESGSANLQSALLESGASLNVAIITPPVKDVREWLRLGMTVADLNELVEAVV